MGALLFRAEVLGLAGAAANAVRAVSEPVRMPAPRPPRDEAIEWIVRLKSGEATEEDVEALQRWRAADSSHEAAFRDAAHLWRGVAAAARELAEEERAAAEPAVAPPPRGFLGRAFGFALALLRARRRRFGARRAP
jgi:ferric-dicitrate binding protein FerR (iron transport regulator)